MEHRCLSPWKGAVAGGLIAFAWSAFSWVALPFHNRTIVRFADPAAVVSMGEMMALGLLVQMIGAFFWTWILGKIPGLTLKDSALYGCFFGLCVGTHGAMSNWVWWKFSLPFTAMYVADAVIAWTLASMALSRCYAAACALPKKP